MMDANTYTKIVLSLILGCLVLLVGRGLGGSDGDVGRYEFVMHKLRRGGPLLVRHDSATGESWGLRGFGGRVPRWGLIHEADAEGVPEDGPPPGN